MKKAPAPRETNPTGARAKTTNNQGGLMTPAYIASGTAISHATLVGKLADRDAILAPDPHFERTQCEWCANVGAVTAFRIWRRPNALHVASEGTADVCALCLPNALDTACSERGIDDDADITIEYPGD